MTAQRYLAYRSLLAELGEWRSAATIEDAPYDQLSDAAEGLLLARAGTEAEEPLAQASTTVLALLASDDLDEPNASWLLDALLACGPRAALAAPVGEPA